MKMGSVTFGQIYLGKTGAARFYVIGFKIAFGEKFDKQYFFLQA